MESLNGFPRFLLHWFLAEVFHHFSCDDQARDGGNECDASRDVTSIGALVGGTWRTDTVVTAADCHILDRPGGRLGGIEDLQVLDLPLA